MRLDKYLSLTLVGTRKKVKGYIYSGDVTVNNICIREPAFEVEAGIDHITYLGNPLLETPKIYYMFHKPLGCITIKSHDNKPTVFDYFKEIDTTGLFAVGRLDKDTQGLLLITNDGDFNHQLMFPDHHVEKTYYFVARGNISKEEAVAIEKGVVIDSGQLTKPAKLEIIKNGCYYDLEEEILACGCKIIGADLAKEEVVAGYLSISEGMKHQVRKMLKSINCTVVYLKRISIGSLILDPTLKEGEYRKLTSDEVGVGTPRQA